MSRKGVVFLFIFNLKEVRKKKNMKQSDLANRLNTAQQVISDYEVGKKTPSLERLVELAQILDVSLDELIEFKKIHHSYSKKIKNK
jgi:transcriptional regulator with XRE-family HTH domain